MTETLSSDRRGRSHGPIKAKVAPLKLVSMMDVCFQLLFFVLTASFTMAEGIFRQDLKHGNSLPQTIQRPETRIHIELRSIGNDQVLIRARELGWQQVNGYESLYKKMLELKDGPNAYLSTDNPIHLVPDKQVSWVRVLEAYNSLKRAGYEELNFDKSAPRSYTTEIKISMLCLSHLQKQDSR